MRLIGFNINFIRSVLISIFAFQYFECPHRYFIIKKLKKKYWMSRRWPYTREVIPYKRTGCVNPQNVFNFWSFFIPYLALIFFHLAGSFFEVDEIKPTGFLKVRPKIWYLHNSYEIYVFKSGFHAWTGASGRNRILQVFGSRIWSQNLVIYWVTKIRPKSL